MVFGVNRKTIFNDKSTLFIPNELQLHHNKVQEKES